MRSDNAGDLRNDDFMAVWNGGHEVIERWRRLNLVGGKCGSCGYQDECGFGCRANAHYMGGDFYGDDPSCIAELPEGIVHPAVAASSKKPTRSDLVQIGGVRSR